MPTFTVLVGAMRHPTAELVIEADHADNARAEADGRLTFGDPAIEWAESPPQDQRIESVIKEG